MPKITIDGATIEVDKGTTVIQAAEKLGIEIPRYCYHPGLSIVGVCRICLVEIERIPKLQVACYTPVTDGMVVHTNNAKVLEARRAVLEFLLINHPLDCPVCDQAGECWLQNFYMQHGLYDSKMYEDKVKKHKAMPIGPNVILDSERCILCSRCVRFCDEVSKTHELGIFNRGDHAELLPYPGRELDNNYSGNTVDICPVGALTDRDFRFRTRVWYLSETKSVCPGCSNGCNIYVHHNDKRPYKAGGIRISRLKPRYNADVNQWWMCDEGRYGFTPADAADRIVAPQKRETGWFSELSWDDAVTGIGKRIKEIIETHGTQAVGVILSPQMTNEDLYAAMRFFNDTLNLEKIDFQLPPLKKGSEDDFLIKADKNPNTAGAKEILAAMLRKKAMTIEQMIDAAASKNLRALYICHHDLEKGIPLNRIESALANLELIIFQGANANSTSALAHYILPSAAYVEKDGTFTNFARRVQKINHAVQPLGESKPDWMIFRNLAKKLGKPMPYFEAEDVFNALSDQVPAFSGLRYKAIGDQGVALNGHKGVSEKPVEAKVA
ncbi:MAG TPA: molybdopterin-dependent oxidoreductase [bacterium]